MLASIKKNLCEKYCFIFLLIITASLVLINDNKLVINIYRLFICLPVLLCVRRDDLREFIKNPFVKLFIILTLWSTATLLWSEPGKLLNMATKLLTTLVLLYLIHLIFLYQPKQIRQFDRYYIGAALVLAANLWLRYGTTYPQDWIFGVFGNINNTGWFFASAIVIALYKLVYDQYKILSALAAALLILAIIPTNTLAAYIAVGIGTFILLISILKQSYQKWIYTTVLSSLCLIILLHFLYPDFFLPLYTRFDNGRVIIYLNAYKEITASISSLFFGSGLATDARNALPSGQVINNWHSIYINMAFYAGLVGLALLLACFTRRLFAVFTGKTTILPWDLAVTGMLVAMLFDGNRIYTYPGGYFIALLIPLFIANLTPIQDKQI